MCIHDTLCCVFISAFCLHLGTFLLGEKPYNVTMVAYITDRQYWQPVFAMAVFITAAAAKTVTKDAVLHMLKMWKNPLQLCLPLSTSLCLSICQVVSASRLVGADHPLEIVYFVEGPSGQRMPADQAANILNNMDVQRAAIILGYRVQGVLAQREYLQISGRV